MTIDTRRIVHTLLLVAGLCACASHQRRSENASDEARSTMAGADASRGEQTAATTDGDSDSDGDERAVRDPAIDKEAHHRTVHAPSHVHKNTNGTDAQTAERDNTAVNERDREGATLTPGDQSNSEGDLEITRRIRETVVDDDGLSFAAKNIKIITVDGRVTLRGPVSSNAERTTIEKMAVAVAGTGRVVNQLEIE